MEESALLVGWARHAAAACTQMRSTFFYLGYTFSLIMLLRRLSSRSRKRADFMIIYFIRFCRRRLLPHPLVSTGAAEAPRLLAKLRRTEIPSSETVRPLICVSH